MWLFREGVLTLITVIFLQGCVSSQQKPVAPAAGQTENPVTESAKQFFEIYAKRQNINQLMDFYAQDAVLEDLVYGELSTGKEAIRAFLDWDNPHFRSIQPNVLVVQEQLVQGSQVITQGYFTPFVYHGQQLGPWRFVIWQRFDKDSKIIHQQDWINYTPKEQFMSGRNLNLSVPASH